jgi:hypothetical protein
MADDRRTGITGDQIEDNTISKDELIVVNDPPSDKMVLGWDAETAKFKWYYSSDLATRLDHYQESEGESSTTSTSWQDKISYTTPTLSAGPYEFWFQSEIEKSGGAVQKVRMIIDDVEYCYNSAEADFNDWKLAKGFKRITLTAGTHTIKVQFASGTSGRAILIRRARIRVLSVGIE